MAKKDLSGNADIRNVTISQSNRVTGAKYHYTLYQERIFTWIMYHLQVYIKEVMSGKSVHQLDLFAQRVESYLIDIPMNRIGKPDKYAEIRTVCEGMTTIPILMQDPEKTTRRVAGLLASVETKIAGKQRTNIVRIEMRQDIVALLLYVDRNDHNRPAQYTQYSLYVALMAKNKYTARIYKLLCSFKERQGFKMKLENFRDFLGLSETSYKNFSDLKRFILIPAQQELKQIADLWFNAADKEFEIYDDQNKKVKGLSFKIIEPMTEEILSKKIDYAFWTMKNTFSCTQYHCERIRPLLNKETDWEALRECFDRCYNYGIDNEVKNMPAFVVKSITNALTPA